MNHVVLFANVLYLFAWIEYFCKSNCIKSWTSFKLSKFKVLPYKWFPLVPLTEYNNFEVFKKFCYFVTLLLFLQWVRSYLFIKHYTYKCSLYYISFFVWCAIRQPDIVSLFLWRLLFKRAVREKRKRLCYVNEI